MAIIKEKKFYIGSVIENLTPAGLVDGTPEKTDTNPEGFFKISDENFNLSYREESENGPIICDVTVCGGTVTVKRVGAVVSEMVFEEGKTHKSLYSVPPYSFDVEIYTKKIRNSLTRDGGRIDIYYTINIGGADKNVKMRIEV